MITIRHPARRRLALLALVALSCLLVLAGAAAAQEPDGGEPDALLANVGTAFTYQGRLVDAGNPASGVYDFQFRLYDAAGGAQIGAPQSVNDVAVADGLFTATLDFGAGAFNGLARWLEIDVKRDADAGYTTLTPRIALSPAPHALALPGLWTQQNATSPNLIGGYAGNVMGAGVQGGVIGGGGYSGFENRVHDIRGTVGGGVGNVVGVNDGSASNQQSATISGGQGNTASHTYATVGGGQFNDATSINATVGGGQNNIASGSGSVVAGGRYNSASGTSSTIGGGWNNQAAASYTTIAGGGPSDTGNPTTSNNRVYDDYGTVGGGGHNVVGVDDSNTVSQRFATVSGGEGNTASGQSAVVGGGTGNNATASSSTVAGGLGNDALTSYSTIGGGWNNEASGNYATVPGGESNLASGVNSFAAGRRAQAIHDGAFVWADRINVNFTSNATDTFSVRSANGARIIANHGGDGLAVYNNGADGVGIFAQNTGSGKDDATIRANNTETSGGVTAYLTNDSNFATVHAYNGSSGEVLYLQNGGDSAGGGGGDFIKAVDEAQSDTQFRVTTTGEARSDVGFTTPAADFAEMLPAVPGLEPGDVLAVGTDGLLVRSTEAYQSTVVGVYSTRPGFVGGMPVEGEAAGKVPLAVVGIVPVKASGEGGAIQPGDLLAASSTPGHAMKAKPDAPQGTVIGKALEPLTGDSGVILMLVILQ